MIKMTDALAVFIAIALGVFSFVIVLSYHNIADGDLWDKFVQGASIWKTGSLVHKDIFSFTPVLPVYIDHEWGAGLIFFSLLKLFGPESLLFFKIITVLGALAFAVIAARLNDTGWPAILILAVPCALTLFPGYIPVVRSHSVTYLFFACTLFCLEKIRKGSIRAAIFIIFVMLLWANIHGGFAAGLGIIGIYAAAAILSNRSSKIMLLTLLAAVLATFINPYGIKFWDYLLPALTMDRAYDPNWRPMQFQGLDSFIGFRILFAACVIAVISGWRSLKGKHSLPQIVTMAVTAYVAARCRRHAPFFGVAALAFLGPYLGVCVDKLRLRIPVKSIAVVYAFIAIAMAALFLPAVTFRVLAPVGFYPVREADILMYSKTDGNLLLPYRWGNYAMWRLYPRIKISLCGRYDAMYPQSTLDMNHDFFFKKGKDWDRIVRQYRVDYIMLEIRNTAVTHEDLARLGFEPVWQSDYSALYARRERAAVLMDIARNLPNRTIQPLDAHIPDSWNGI